MITFLATLGYILAGIGLISLLIKWSDFYDGDVYDFISCVILWPFVLAIMLCFAFGELFKMYIDWLKDQ